MSWSVVTVARYAHRVVERELAVIGIASFYPRLRHWVSHARRKVAVERPLLGPYVFVEGVVDVDRVADVQDVVGAIEDEIVWSWRRRYMAGEFDVTQREMPVDAMVRIYEGEFAEMIARVKKVKRVMVEVEIGGTGRVITTRRDNVGAA